MTQIIGAAGGTITSSDNGLTLTIPAGALAADATFTLTPVTNTLSGGVGTAYQLDAPPETADVLMQVTLMVPAAKQAGTDGLGLALQDETGAWWSVPGTTATPAVRVASAPVTQAAGDASISGQVKRNSPAGKLVKSIGAFANLYLLSQPVSVKVNKSTTLSVQTCEPRPNGNGPADFSWLSCKNIGRRATSVTAAAGTLSETAPGALLYTAPASRPNPDPVSFSLTYDNVNGTSSRVILVGAISVIEDYMETYTGRIYFRGAWAQDQPNSKVGLEGLVTVTLVLDRTSGITVPGEVASYKLTGKGTWKQTPADCDERSVTASIYGSMGLWDTDSPNKAMARKYVFSFTTVESPPTFTFQCGNPRAPVKLPAFVLVDAPCTNIEGGLPARAPSHNDKLAYLIDGRQFDCPSNPSTGQSLEVIWELTGQP